MKGRESPIANWPECRWVSGDREEEEQCETERKSYLGSFQFYFKIFCTTQLFYNKYVFLWKRIKIKTNFFQKFSLY